MSSQVVKNEIFTTDGVPLKESLRRAERRNKTRAFLLVVPLALFIIITFVVPIFDMLLRSVDDKQINTVFPRTFELYKQWDGEELPSEKMYATMFDLSLIHKSEPTRQAEMEDDVLWV